MAEKQGESKESKEVEVEVKQPDTPDEADEEATTPVLQPQPAPANY